MSKPGSKTLLLVLAFSFLVIGAHSQQNEEPAARGSKPDLRALAALEPIDTHTHVAKSDARFNAMLDRVHMHILDIILVDDHEPYRKDLNIQRQDAEAVVHASPGNQKLCTSFDPFAFNDTGFASSAIAALNRDFSNAGMFSPTIQSGSRFTATFEATIAL